jgi:hypothetical protein
LETKRKNWIPAYAGMTAKKNEALETGEDIALVEIAEEREKTFKKTRALSHREVWG